MIPILRTQLRAAGRRDLAARQDADLAPLAEICRGDRQALFLVARTLAQRPMWSAARYLQAYGEVAQATDEPLAAVLRVVLSEIATRRPSIAARWFLLAILAPAPFHLDLAAAIWELEEVADNRVEGLLDVLAEWGLLVRHSREHAEMPAHLHPLALDRRLDLPAFPARERWRSARLLALDGCLDACAFIAELADEDPAAARYSFRGLWPHLATVVEHLGWDEEIAAVLAQIPRHVAAAAQLSEAPKRARALATAAWSSSRDETRLPGDESLGEVRALRSEGRYEEALDRLQEALEDFQATRSPEGEVAALYEIGVTLIAAERFGEALVPLEEAVRLQNEEPLDTQLCIRCLVALGSAAIELAESEQALDALEEAQAHLASVDDSNLGAEVETLLGRAYLEMGAWRRALGHITSALALAPVGSERYRAAARLIELAAQSRDEIPAPDQAALDAAVRWLREHDGIDSEA